MVLLDVVVPEGVGPGDELLVEGPGGQQLVVVCPDGAVPGSSITVEFAEEAAAPAPQLVDVTVPDGCWPGDEFEVSLGDTQFVVVVPEGVAPGDVIEVAVPPPAPPGEGEAPPTESPLEEKPKKKGFNLQLGLLGGTSMS